MGSCFCGAGRTFSPGEGCLEDASCPAEQLCLATRGEWHPASECYCGFTCGLPGACGACLDSCNCGPHRNFDPESGCEPDEVCGGPSRQEICEATGGEWTTGSCGDFECGMPNDLACTMPGCNCGYYSNYAMEHGCLYDASCTYRDTWMGCHGAPVESTCRPGLLCCPECLIPAIPYCAPPCCPDEPFCAESGCMLCIET